MFSYIIEYILCTIIVFIVIGLSRMLAERWRNSERKVQNTIELLAISLVIYLVIRFKFYEPILLFVTMLLGG